MSFEPLAYRMRPKTLEDIAGHDDLIGENTALYKMIKKGHVPSLLLYGPAGCGKTSLANAIAGSSNLPFFTLNATQAGKKDIEDIINETRLNGKILLFIDEIHRFSKLQQDTLLPAVENGWVVLIGATTENPFHDVNPAIRSRCGQIKKLNPLTPNDMMVVLKRALTDKTKGLGKENIVISDDVLNKIAGSVQGDVRSALTILEDAMYATKEIDGCLTILEETVDQCIQGKGISYDKNGDVYYDLLSALQKSIRGSDVNAALHYLARLIQGGDLTSICRRLTVIAYEDCGLASPNMGMKTYSAVESAKMVGFPEARIILGQLVIELCLASKSNSAYLAINKAMHDVEAGNDHEIPPHLKDSHYSGAKTFGHGEEYLYPHDYQLGSFGGWVKQTYLPETLKGREYYEPKVAGEEKRTGSIYTKLKEFFLQKNR